jgi:hypothetical protein
MHLRRLKLISSNAEGSSTSRLVVNDQFWTFILRFNIGE